MNKYALKDKVLRILSFVYDKDFDALDRVLLEIDGNISNQYFFLNRKTLAKGDYLNSLYDYLDQRDKLQALLNYPFPAQNLIVGNVPANYAEVLKSKVEMPTGRGTEGAKEGGGTGIINLGSLEGIGGILFTPEKTVTETITKTEVSPEAVKTQNTTRIIITVIVVAAVVVLIYYLTKKLK